MEEAGGRPELVAIEAGTARAMHHLDPGDTFEVDATTAEADPDRYDAVMLPGGVANADRLRTDGAAVALVVAAAGAGKPVAVICHGPWTLVEGDLVRGRTLTSWPSLRTDIENAGGTWVDREVQVCTNGPSVLVSSRKPDDLPAFCKEMVAAFAGPD